MKKSLLNRFYCCFCFLLFFIRLVEIASRNDMRYLSQLKVPRNSIPLELIKMYELRLFLLLKAKSFTFERSSFLKQNHFSRTLASTLL